MPPKGTVQRRLTFTANTAHPGCSGIVRSSPDGSRLAFLAEDAKGISQIFTISPDGGTAASNHRIYASNITDNLRWHPCGKHITYVYEGSIVLCGVNDAPFEERTQVLTEPSAAVPGNLVWSADGKRLAFNRRVKSEAGKSTQQVFVLSFEKN
jgi:Tol biopolymer transport system component